MKKPNFAQLPRLFILGLVKVYQYCISPLFPPTCRFTPCCSTYMIQAVEKHGVIRGVALGLWRILRCHPFSKGGYDPVK
ncbi:membrane protein insertion efficiency factor YidD [Desulfotalea psychrophila]|uniref:membrane protein insertion efficiency factor YidD n=1 Tax=Desulfotalea psychrophila TaxID=84980 RepID=UPI000A04418C|nr:membrane protein insertion efficiency factor YidD [Desulfotalea psychrophila]